LVLTLGSTSKCRDGLLSMLRFPPPIHEAITRIESHARGILVKRYVLFPRGVEAHLLVLQVVTAIDVGVSLPIDDNTPRIGGETVLPHDRKPNPSCP
jgi:hypothetical protein